VTDPTFKQSVPNAWTMVVNITGGLPGGLEDWPAHIADPILDAIERQCKPQAGWEARVVSSACYPHPDLPGIYYLQVVVGEWPTAETLARWKRLN
jgi:hypothetical protein